MLSLPLSTLIDVAGGEAVGLRAEGESIGRVVIDSRQARAGDVFCALRGERTDGHLFVESAFGQGAVAAIVRRDWAAAVKRPARLIAVADPLDSLWRAAAFQRDRCDALRIGVTGSVGKTTTRRMLHTVLSRRFAGIESPHNYNNQFGVPLSLLELEPDHEFAAIEVGASRVGEIAALAELAAPEIGVITAIAPAHLETFGNVDEICRAKGELLEALPTSGFAVLNGDDRLVRRLGRRAACRVIYVGEEIHNDVVASRVRSNDRRLRFQVGEAEYQLPALGRHHLTSALLSLAVAREVGLSEAEIAAGLKAFTPAAGRCEKLTIGEWTVIDDAYNANPVSMLAACAVLRELQEAGRRVLVLGDMLELGVHAADLHRQLGDAVAECRFDRVLAVGEFADEIAGSARRLGFDCGCVAACRDIETAQLLLDCWLEPGDVILVKGSRGMRMERIVNYLRGRAEQDGREESSAFKKVA